MGLVRVAVGMRMTHPKCPNEKQRALHGHLHLNKMSSSFEERIVRAALELECAYGQNDMTAMVSAVVDIISAAKDLRECRQPQQESQ